MDDFCYKETEYIQSYLNLPHVQEALRIEEHMPAFRNYTVDSEAVATAFYLTNDFGISMEAHVRYILESEVDILFYQGNLDLACNTAGNLRWADSMSWKGQAEFASKRLIGWGESVGIKGKKAGTMKEVKVRMGEGEKRTRFAFVTIDGSGHMVPQDQPKIALDMLERWLGGKEFD
jgi:cathepsin A (carboxypeptidase C)